MKKIALIIFPFLLSIALHGQTKLVVRAKAKDAKFIGSSIGGARIIIREVATGEIMAQGITEGSTGNTDKIMQEPHQRYGTLSDENTSKFEAMLDITSPTFVEITAIAPINQKQAAIEASTQTWIIPGKDIDGDGIIIEIPGFVVDVLAPQTHERMDGNTIDIVANVVMMCGCPISSGGMWDADEMEVQAIVNKDGELYETATLHISDKNNTFKTILNNIEPGLYEIVVYAFDPRTGNSGLDKVNFIVR